MQRRQALRYRLRVTIRRPTTILGLLGLVASIYWARRTHWRNLDEFLRAIGTVLVSLGMIVLLRWAGDVIGTSLMIGAVGAFIAAFVVGRQWGHPADPGPGAGPGDETQG